QSGADSEHPAGEHRRGERDTEADRVSGDDHNLAPSGHHGDADDYRDDEVGEDVCIRCGKPLPIEGFCCEAECLEAGAGDDEKMWKEKYDNLKLEFDQLRDAHHKMAATLADLPPKEAASAA